MRSSAQVGSTSSAFAALSSALVSPCAPKLSTSQRYWAGKVICNEPLSCRVPGSSLPGVTSFQFPPAGLLLRSGAILLVRFCVATGDAVRLLILRLVAGFWRKPRREP